LTLSVLTFASAIALVLAGLDTTSRPARLANTVAIAQVFPVASNATSSAGPRLSAKARTPSGVVSKRPAWITSPFCQVATWANSRCTSSPMHCRSVLVSITFPPLTITTMIGSGRAKRHLQIRARGTTGADRRGGHLLTRALSPPNDTGLPSLLHSQRPCPGGSHRMPARPRTNGEGTDGIGGAGVFHTGYERIESMILTEPLIVINTNRMDAVGSCRMPWFHHSIVIPQIVLGGAA
jgi:hypothetical protein